MQTRVALANSISSTPSHLLLESHTHLEKGTDTLIPSDAMLEAMKGFRDQTDRPPYGAGSSGDLCHVLLVECAITNTSLDAGWVLKGTPDSSVCDE